MIANARNGETLESAGRREGELTLGVWLPLALASIYGVLWNSNRDKDAPVRELPEILNGWCLPHLGAMVEREQQVSMDKDLGDNIAALIKRFGVKNNG